MGAGHSGENLPSSTAIRKRPLVGTIHEDDWIEISVGVDLVKSTTQYLASRGVPVAVQCHYRYWEYGTVVQMIIDHYGKPGLLDVLDVGAGFGALGPTLQMTYDLNMTEYEPDGSCFMQRERCNTVLKSHGKKGINLRQCDLMNMPEQDFDVVACVSVIEHVLVEHERQCWSNLTKCVRPNGLLFIDVDCVPDKTKKYESDQYRAQNFTIDDIKERIDILQQQGFEMIGEPDWNYNGSFLYGEYTFFRVGMRRV